MRTKKLLLSCLIFFGFALLPSCSNSATNNKVEEAPKQEAHDSKPKKELAEEDLPLIKVGDNIKDILASIKVKTVKAKNKDLKNFLGSDKTLIAIVKPGCIYCESMLAIKSATGTKTKAEFLVIVDSAHADFKAFKTKYEKFKSAGGEWLYDVDDAMKNKLGVNSYPRFILVDKNGLVEHYQTGLTMPENKEDFEGKSFPEVLQSLSEETMRWMSKQ